MVTSWQEGFDQVNEMYSTDIKVRINPILEHVVEDAVDPEPVAETPTEETPGEEESAEEPETKVEEETPTEEEKVEEVIEDAMDKNIEEGDENVEKSENS
jgi:hypothetical protein